MIKNKTTIHIAIDANEANVTHRVGSNVYAFEIISELHTLIHQSNNISVTVLLSAPALKDLPKTTAQWQYKVVKPTLFWTQLALPWYLFWNKNVYDVLFTPGHYAPRWSAIPYVSSVMDLAFLHFPNQFKRKDFIQLKNWTEYSVKNAHKVITISEFSKSEVEHFYKKKSEDISVAYPAATALLDVPVQATRNKIVRSLKITQPFILHLGTLQPRKNVTSLVEAFEQLKRSLEAGKLQSTKRKQETAADKRFHSLSGLQLVLAGKEGWLAEPILERVKNSPFKKDIILTGFIDDTTKMTLLKEASTLAMVGRFEGFGIPALEALVVGVLPVVSNQSSLPEVVGGAGITVNPDSIDSIAEGLQQALSLSAKERAQFRKFGREQMKKFSWKQSAQSVLDILLEVVNASK